jgi:hypothetical protein
VISHLLQVFAGIYLIAMVSLLVGLLRTAKASSTVAAEQQDRLTT